MKEDFLHYVWQYKKFDFSNLMTTMGETVTIIKSGDYLQQAGPDFFNAQIVIGSQKWAGNIEIHIKSSDWYLHNHEQDANYDNVILHVVWEYDTPIYRKDNSEIPTLAIKQFVNKDILENYYALNFKKSWIYCETEIGKINEFIFKNWQERLFFERLERKAIQIEEFLATTENDWEAVLFSMLTKNFGLNTNGESFLKIAKAIPFSIIRKESYELKNIESLLFGTANLFPVDAQDNYSKDLKNRFDYLSIKYKLEKTIIEPVQFFKHRPDNFPTIRLAQLAMLYHKNQNLFSKISAAKTLNEFYAIFDITVSEYWQTHYQFEKMSVKKKKQLSKSFIDLIIINTIVPIQFAYEKMQNKEPSEATLTLLKEIVAEKNVIIEKFSNFGVVSKNAFDTQSLLQLKNEYCNNGKCLNCAIGIELLKV